MPTCYFFKDGQIVKEYPNWTAYSADNLYTPEPGTYHWEVGDPRLLEYSKKGLGGIDIAEAPPEIQTLILLLG